MSDFIMRGGIRPAATDPAAAKASRSVMYQYRLRIEIIISAALVFVFVFICLLLPYSAEHTVPDRAAMFLKATRAERILIFRLR